MEKLIRKLMTAAIASAVIFTGCKNDNVEVNYIPHVELPESVGDDIFAGKSFIYDDKKYIAGDNKTICRYERGECYPIFVYNYSYNTEIKEFYMSVKYFRIGNENKLYDYPGSIAFAKKKLKEIKEELKTIDKEDKKFSILMQTVKTIEENKNSVPFYRRLFELKYAFSYDTTNGIVLTQKFTGVDTAGFLSIEPESDTDCLISMSIYPGIYSNLIFYENFYTSIKLTTDKKITFINNNAPFDKIIASYTIDENDEDTVLTLTSDDLPEKSIVFKFEPMILIHKQNTYN